MDRLEYYQHATTLGGGTESLLGYVEGALKQGSGSRVDVYAAACRSAFRHALSLSQDQNLMELNMLTARQP